MSATPHPILDHAFARIGPLDGVRVTLAPELSLGGAALSMRLRQAGADLCDGPPGYLLGAAGGDLSGFLGATASTPPITQNVGVVDLSVSPLMGLVRDRIGVGQASVMALLDITNLQLAGRSVAVCGYGPSGAGVAFHAKALGARVTVVEDDPQRAVQALLEGYVVERFATALPRAEVVFVTGEGPYLGSGQVKHLRPGTILAAAGSNAAIAPEIVASGGQLRPVRAHVEAFDLPGARGLKLIAKGQPVHLAEGQGLPVEVNEIVQALHILALRQLLREPMALPLCRPLDPVEEAGLAAAIVAARGGALEGRPTHKST